MSNCTEKEKIYVYMKIIAVKRKENWKKKQEKKQGHSALKKSNNCRN